MKFDKNLEFVVSFSQRLTQKAVLPNDAGVERFKAIITEKLHELRSRVEQTGSHIQYTGDVNGRSQYNSAIIDYELAIWRFILSSIINTVLYYPDVSAIFGNQNGTTTLFSDWCNFHFNSFVEVPINTRR